MKLGQNPNLLGILSPLPTQVIGAIAYRRSQVSGVHSRHITSRVAETDRVLPD
jgi:hypothetical protein